MDKEEKVQLGLAIGSVAAFIMGLRRLAGAIVLYDGYRAYQHHHKPHAMFSAGVGGAFLLFPGWPETVGGAVRGAIGGAVVGSNPQLPPPAPIANFASLTRPAAGGDELYMGNWTLFDVAETQTPAIAAKAKSLKPGDTAALVLGQPGAPPMVFKVKVIPGGPAGRYVGQWITQPPRSGPQFADFGPQHYLSA